MTDEEMAEAQAELDREASGEVDPLEPKESPFKTWKDGSRVFISFTSQTPDGDDVVVTSSMDVEKVKEKLRKDPTLMKKDPIGPLYLSRLAKIIVTQKLCQMVCAKMDRALKMYDRPLDFVMGEVDTASVVKEGIPIALDVLSAIYPVLGVPLKTVYAASQGDAAAHKEITSTVDAAKQGDPEAKKQAQDLQQALEIIRRLEEEKGTPEKGTPYSKKVPMGPSDSRNSGGGWYERGL